MAAMAVKVESLHCATESLILPKPRKYYRAHMKARYVECARAANFADPSLQVLSHEQLRSLISSPQQNIVYYPSGTFIYRLNTRTREREIITKLSFSPQCLTAAKGWLCCGGDDGNYTAISLGDRKVDHDFSVTLDADPDARLPLDLDPPRRSTLRDTLSTPRSLQYPLAADVQQVGTAIVNCVSLWFPTLTTTDRTYQIPVAVVANNDSTVHVLNIQDSEVLEKLTYPDFVNRAVISPDGELLVAICDDPFLYIHQRKQQAEHGNGRFGTKRGIGYEWALWGRIQLEGQRQADKCKMRGSFAAAFSKSGKYLAVATQYGIISVFDTETITKEDADPLLAVFTTSRPGQGCGAVRAMEFSPEPFDLLAWTESTGRVGIADVRNLCLSRQLITIDSHGDGVERVIISERPDEPVIDSRLRSFRADSPSSSSTTLDYLGLESERRQARYLARELLDRHTAPLTVEEMDVLQAHRVARRQRHAARDALADAHGTSGWGLTPDGQRSSTTLASSTNAEGSNTTDRRISTTSLPAAVREFVNADRSRGSFRTFITDQNPDRERRSLPQEPRRRSSIILAASDNPMERETLGTGVARNGNDPPSGLEHLTLAPPRLPVIGSDSSNSPWAAIEALYRSRVPLEPPVDRATRLRIEVENDESRDFGQLLRQPWRLVGDPDQIGLGVRDDNTLPRGVPCAGSVETMGCCWSEDGRILYVGGADGIHEYHVNVTGRKRFPSLVLR